MTTSALPPGARGSVNDRLVTTLFLAALFHGILILGVSFGAGPAEPDALPRLEVLLVNDDLPAAPTNPNADYLSQRTQKGSGNTLESRRAGMPSSTAAALDNPGSEQGNAQTTQENSPETQSAEVLATWGTGTQVVHIGAVTDADPGTPQSALLLRSGEASPLPSAEIGEEALVLQGERRGELLVTPNTRESDVAVYLDRWRHKVERLGTLHFPQEVRRRGLSGSPVLEVAIRANGELEDMVVRRSSGHAQLDQAALSILRLSTPFDPFPAELRQRHQVLRFAYEWQFLGGALVDSTVRAGTEMATDSSVKP